MSEIKKAVVLLSGGLDSATSAAIAAVDGYELCALSFRYGQRHAVELDAAKAVAKNLGIKKHVVLDIDLRQFGGSALTADIDVPKHDDASEIEDGIPITYVPARNTIFLSFALGWAEVLNAFDIYIGVNALDYSGYPDCRGEFISAFQDVANLATKAGVEGKGKFVIHTPLINLSKAEIIQKAAELNVDLSKTVSCYDPADDGLACGACDSCLLRKKGFTESGINDVTRYQA